MFHEEVQNWSLSAGAFRWSSLGPLVGALVLHGMAALMLIGESPEPPPTAAVYRAAGPDAASSALLQEVMVVSDTEHPSSTAPPLSPPTARFASTAAQLSPTAAHVSPRASSAVHQGSKGSPPAAPSLDAEDVASNASVLTVDASSRAMAEISGVGMGSSRETRRSSAASALGQGGQSAARRGADSASASAGARVAQGARLVPASLRCADLFPYAARSDRETLAVEVAVSSTGGARTSRIVSGHRHEAVFDAAALACAQRLQFIPAQSTHGAEVEGRAVVRLRFERAS